MSANRIGSDIFLSPDESRNCVSLIDATRTKWRMTPKHEGNTAFFEFARKLKKAGISDVEIEATLTGEAQHAHSPGERQRQIPSIMQLWSQHAD